MEMIIGGAFQGKLAYAQKQHPAVTFIEGDSIEGPIPAGTQGIHGFHNYIKKQMKEGKEVSGLARQIIADHPDLILISDEVGYGVVPIDKFDRAYREAVGRVCTELASYSSKVTRVALGIGTVIKNV